MDDVRPYRHEGTPLVEVPIQWTLDDAPHFWFDSASWTKRIATAGDGALDLGRGVPRHPEMGGCCVFTMHPQVIGRPIGWRSSTAFIGFVARHEDVWVATTAEIAGRM